MRTRPEQCVEFRRARHGWCWSAAAILFLSCKPEYSSASGPVFLPEEVRRDGALTVRLSLAQNNAMASRLVVENLSGVPVTLSKKNVTLRIGDLGSAHPVANYGDYVYKRLRTAKRACESERDLSGCRQKITEYFLPYFSALPFRFGSIKPGEICEGAIAFDVLDPYNRSKKAKRLRSTLDTLMARLPITISVTMTSQGISLPFTFSYSAEAVHDSVEKAFGVLRFYP